MCGVITVLLQFAHELKLNPVHDAEPVSHVQLHLDQVSHEHEGDETIDEQDLTLLKIHTSVHNLGYFLDLAMQLSIATLPKQAPPLAAPRIFLSLRHQPPVPPPLC
ncbi:MAG: hypothetical protein MI750_07915 [Xanthomonadales bacterium]|jgi:hypothetical protein|nr:hypothetical protein [Xanthomonadales bacterium]